MAEKKRREGQSLGELSQLRNRISELEESITKLRRLEESLRDSEAQYRTIFETTGTAMLVIDDDMTISMANTEVEAFAGYKVDEVVGRKKWMEFIVDEDRDRMEEYHRLRRLNPTAAPKNYEFRMIDRNGNIKDVMLTVSLVPETKKSIASLSDITERKRMEEELRHLSTHDALTGLYNRTYFEEEMVRLERGRHFPVSILMVDVDQLKETNDTRGHAAGDDLLRRTATVLKAVFRGEDVVARIGGDEFSVLLPNTEASVVKKIVKRIRDSLALHNKDHFDFLLSFSIGFATGDKGCSLKQVQNEADRNMYGEKPV